MALKGRDLPSIIENSFLRLKDKDLERGSKS
jgi:hypothetical protein